jgi:hypothetical protein
MITNFEAGMPDLFDFAVSRVSLLCAPILIPAIEGGTMHLTRALCVIAMITMASPVATAQKGGKPKTQDRSATAAFRCAGLEPCGPSGFVVSDSIAGDGGAYVGVGDLISGSEAFLRSDGEFSFDLRAGGGGFVYLKFAEQVAGPSGSVSRKTFDEATLDSFHLNTNVINPATGQDASGALLAIPVGQTWPSRIKAFWTDPYGIDYVIRFNPDQYPGSTSVWITRESETTWSIEAGHAEIARLVSIPHDPKGKPGSLAADEGLYVLPFRILVTVP